MQIWFETDRYSTLAWKASRLIKTQTGTDNQGEHSGHEQVLPNARAALDGVVQDGMTLAIGGFGLCGIPEALDSRPARHRRAQTLPSRAITPAWMVGTGLLLERHQIKKMISSYVGENLEFERQFLAGELRGGVLPARHAC